MSSPSRAAHALLAAALLLARPAAALQDRTPLRDTVQLGPLHRISDVAAVRPTASGPTFGPPNEQADLYLSLRHPLLDPTRNARRTVERAELADAQAGVQNTLFPLRAQVNDAFFALLLHDARIATIDNAIADLAARRRHATARLDAGAALPSDVTLLDAELARRHQTRGDVVAERDAAREVLGLLVGRPIAADAVIAIPTTRPLADTTDLLDGLDRPERAQFEANRAVLEARRRALAAQRLPRLSLVGRTGYGRPGLNQLGRTFDSYVLAGLQVDWAPWNWGATRREEEVAQLQSRVVANAEAAFIDGVRRAVAADRVRLRALDRALATDDTIVALRTRILDEARRRHDEGDITAAEYVARQTDLLDAQLERDQRRVRRAETTVRLLTTLGREIR
ncbi:MAG: TolC family protein [Gemmatimonadaceae bacterium]|nr:TolC family protein [Gemmatimonadaceae bacterium]